MNPSILNALLFIFFFIFVSWVVAEVLFIRSFSKRQARRYVEDQRQFEEIRRRIRDME
jgi:heme/copper-type cytochrome/quinol oxidase subunit 2